MDNLQKLRIESARIIIEAGLEIMNVEQVSQWEGVRLWLAAVAGDF